MERYQSKDLIADLGVLVDRDVKHYQSDFNIDKEILLKAAKEKRKDLLWITRENGTHCMDERNAFISGTYGNSECLTFLPFDCAKAYFLEIEGIENGKIVGNICPTNANELYEEVLRQSVPPHEVEICPKDSDAFRMSYDDYNNRCWEFSREYPGFTKKYFPDMENERNLSSLLCRHRNARERAIVKDISQLLKIKLPSLDDSILEAGRSIAGKRNGFPQKNANSLENNKIRS